MPKYVPLNDALAAYLDRHRFDRDEEHYEALKRQTVERFGERQEMQIGADQGAFLSLLVGLVRPSLAVEVGTFTGYSAYCIARALPPGGHLHCFDISEEFTALAREFWERTGVADRITLHLGPATDLLDELPATASVGFAFIDADKTGYDRYYETLLPRMIAGGATGDTFGETSGGISGGTSGGGLFVFDNMLWHGKVTDESLQDQSTLAIRALNAKLVTDPRVEATLIPVGDGLLLARKR